MSNEQKLTNNYLRWRSYASVLSVALLLWLNNLAVLASTCLGTGYSTQTSDHLSASGAEIAQRAIPTFSSEAQTPLEELPPAPEEPPAEFFFETPPPATLPTELEIPPGYDPPPFEDLPSNQFTPYRLGIGDGIAVTVERFPEFNTQSVMSGEGNIVVPLLGRISLLGLTLEEAETKISLALNERFLQEPPQVVVQVAGFRPTQITISGEVFRPGFYTIPSSSTLAAALLVAGGSTTHADLRSVIVRRSLLDGSVMEQKVNLLEPIQNGRAIPSLRLQDGDSVIVSQLEVGEDQDYDNILASRSTLAQQQIRIRVLSYAGAGVGTLPLSNGSTFLDAITAISPSLENANLDRIALVRFDPEQGKAVSQTINAKAVIEGDIAQNVPLQDNDVIIIGRNLIAKITFALSRFTQPFRDVLGFLLFFDQLGGSARDLFQFNER